MTGESLNTTTPFVQLFDPEEVTLVNSTNFTLTHTLDPVLTKDAGPYFCKAILEVEGLDMPLELESFKYNLYVQGNGIIFCHILKQYTSLSLSILSFLSTNGDNQC